MTIDGDPQLSKVENSNLMRVVNTPFFIVLNPKSKEYYLKGDDRWFSAREVMGPWQKESRPPASVVALAASEFKTHQQKTTQKPVKGMLEIIVATTPTELIQTDGKPKYTPIRGTGLLYMSNTKSNVFMKIDSQQYFVLLSGRWYSAKSLKGKWSYVKLNKLPADFAKIPPGSAKAEVLAHVTGTDDAREAVLDTYIPQTTAIKRGEAEVAVIYDGKPKFKKIEGTNIYYVVNTPYSVIRVGKGYYLCSDAVWFVASNPMGPWTVCTSVPQVIYTIPPSCPIYNVKYVYVYGYTVDVVYVGYTPGYVGCYVYGGTVVYGTGYVYHGWYGTVYYAYPVTYGYAVIYHPYRGWHFATGFMTGWVASHAWHHGWWGVGGWRNIDIDININRNIYRHGRGLAGPRGPADPRGVRDPRGLHDPRGIGDPRGPRDPRGPADPRGPVHANDVLADRDGNVYRKTDKGWQQRETDGWSDRGPEKRGTSSRPVARQSGIDRTETSLNRHHKAREQGTKRTNNYRELQQRTPGRRR
ncbi:MAG: hypothetical protein JRJ27_15160 [Deltaproteobacteria bacterium]|nr:hypothetical protein [Deltaproteobacteria bacterium]